ncbi:sulfatase-like hydrolase/transferase [Flammeovirga sp. MY04]|uniref:sulfatase-like hydrolase/transferase n=1 Tax=Flammeovirga sp. MY04 TaxID=1191459 RepID=UPI0008060DB1|nr:sulfatase-like hydrolase/transferase [Flammeovirga sp. MY04]ANQ52409.1 sulfatase-like hydrolase/transferase [Flammeovirga sp. MY04]
MKKYILFVLYLLISLSLKAQRPNVVLIYTDDHRYTGIHALGGMQVKTPNIDALADEGVVFTKAYLMGAFTGATCMPSRAMLLSGRSLFQLEGKGYTLPKKHTTIGESFQAAGYHTHMVGKWHQDRKSLNRSFNSGGLVMGLGAYLVDHYRMPLWEWNKKSDYKTEDSFLIRYDKNDHQIRTAYNPKEVKGPISNDEEGPHTSEIFSDQAISFIENYQNEKPFFMYLAYHAPHDPRQSSKKYKKHYPIDKIELPPSYLGMHPFDNGHMNVRDEALASWPRTETIAKEHLSDYYSIITHLDHQIGRVIEVLKETGRYENTIIVLAGDSGLAVGNHGLMGKQNIYDEDGIHVPFIISGGKIDAPKRLDALCYIHDIFPTICDLAGIDTPKSATGISLAKVINGEKTQIRDYTYHAYRQHQRAYRVGDYKLIEYVSAPDYSNNKGEFRAGSRVTQLFKLSEDPWEVNNLAALDTYQPIVEKMRIEMMEKSKSLGDTKKNTGERYDFWENYQINRNDTIE